MSFIAAFQLWISMQRALQHSSYCEVACSYLFKSNEMFTIEKYCVIQNIPLSKYTSVYLQIVS